MRIKSAVCLCVCMSKSLVDPVVFPVLSRQQADEVAGSSERNTLQHVCACLCMCVCIFASVWAYETYQGPVNSAKSHESSKV